MSCIIKPEKTIKPLDNPNNICHVQVDYYLKPRDGGYQMSKYKINVTVNLVACDDETDNNPIELDDGSYQYTINENAGESIDDCEIAILKTAFPAMRKAIVQHLETVSKKKS